MSNNRLVYIGVEPMLERTLDVLREGIPARAPEPKLIRLAGKGDIPMVVFGPVQRPVFEIDEADLPY